MLRTSMAAAVGAGDAVGEGEAEAVALPSPTSSAACRRDSSARRCAGDRPR